MTILVESKFQAKLFLVKVNFKKKNIKIEDFYALTLRSLRLCVKNNCNKQLKSPNEH